MAKYTFLDFIRNQRAPTPPVPVADLAGKTVVVTGANVGLGFEAAKHFARMNPLKVVLACRSREKGAAALAELERETGYSRGEVRIIDLGSFESVTRFADAFEAENERLDILICNAGISAVDYEVSPTGHESTIQVNHLSTALLSLRLLPLMQRTADRFATHPRLVIVSSEMHFWAGIDAKAINSPRILDKLSEREYCTPAVMQERYPVSKLLNVLYTRGLAAHLPSPSRIVLNTVNPGYCLSSIRRNLRFPVSFICWIMDILLARTTEEGSRQLVWAALAGDTNGDTQLREQVYGKYISDYSIKEESDWVFTKAGQECERRLWDETVEILAKADPKVKQVVQEYLRQP